MENILVNHMGKAFSKLAPLLQRVHTGSSHLSGTVKVSRGNVIARIICQLFKFPAQNNEAKLTVDCEHSANQMTWKRNFDGLKMESSFRLIDESLIEYLGPLAMSFTAIESDGDLVYQFVHTRFWGIPMPNVLSPKIEAYEREVDGKYHFSVKVKMFLVGPVIAYSGELSVAN